MNIKRTVGKKEIAKLFRHCCDLESIQYDDYDVFENSIINEFNKKNKTSIKIKIYFEKDEDGNHYYFSGKKLYNCSLALQEIHNNNWESAIPLYVQKIIDEIFELLFLGNEENCIERKTEKILDEAEDYIKNIVYCITNNTIIINRWFGGFKSKITNDCELEIELNLLPTINKNEVKKSINRICQKYDAKWIRI